MQATVLPSGFYCCTLVEKKKKKVVTWHLQWELSLCICFHLKEFFFFLDHTTVLSPLHFIVIFASNIFVSFSMKSKVKSDSFNSNLKKRTQKQKRKLQEKDGMMVESAVVKENR